MRWYQDSASSREFLSQCRGTSRVAAYAPDTTALVLTRRTAMQKTAPFRCWSAARGSRADPSSPLRTASEWGAEARAELGWTATKWRPSAYQVLYLPTRVVPEDRYRLCA
eukprot:2136778-Rhodomonas_salina.4